jgi:hypothetical protein
MDISTMKVALTDADNRRTNMKYNGVSAAKQTRIKISCDGEGARLTCNISVSRESMESTSKFCFLPLGALKDVCTCHLRVILLPPAPWSIFRADSPVTPMQKFLSSTSKYFCGPTFS